MPARGLGIAIPSRWDRRTWERPRTGGNLGLEVRSMRRWLMRLGAAGLMALPGFSQVGVVSIVVDENQLGKRPVVTVELRNRGQEPQMVDSVRLLLRDQSTWQTVKTWNSPVLLQPGQKLSVRVIPDPDSPLYYALTNTAYHLDASVAFREAGDGMEAADR